MTLFVPVVHEFPILNEINLQGAIILEAWLTWHFIYGSRDGTITFMVIRQNEFAT